MSEKNKWAGATVRSADLCQVMRDINRIEASLSGTGGLVEAFSTADFAAATEFTYVGTARHVGASARLTDMVQNSLGGVWFGSRVRVLPSFHTQFTFRMIPKYGRYYGADGLSFIIQNKQAAYLQGDGGDLGCSFDNRMAVEFDTYGNGVFHDPAAVNFTYNHVGVFITPDGVFQHPDHAYARLTKRVENPSFFNTQITVDLTYDGTTLSIIVTGAGYTVTGSAAVDLSTLTLTSGTRAWVGINAACGLAYQCHQAHWIDSWFFEQPDADPYPQTEWQMYFSDGTTRSVGVPDAGLHVPDLNHLWMGVPRTEWPAGSSYVQVHVGLILQIRKALERLVRSGMLLNPATGVLYDWAENSVNNAYYVGVHPYLSDLGVSTPKHSYTWQRGAILGLPVAALEIGEVALCTDLLRRAAVIQGYLEAA